jgi:hypothetical protein
MRTGALKNFERSINNILHDARYPPQVRELLDIADANYKNTIPFLNDEMVKAVMKHLESGAGADPDVIARVLFDPDRTAALRRARSILGENTWRTVEAAHTKQLIDNSRVLTVSPTNEATTQVDFTKFASQVEDLMRNNLLGTAYSPAIAGRLLELAKQMGQFKGSIQIPVGANDTLSMIMRRGAVAKERAKILGETDPFKAIEEEVERIRGMEATAQKEMRSGLESSPIGFLYKDSMSEMAVTAADTILANQDMVKAFRERFGPDSEAFRALQKVWVQRFFQRPFEQLGQMRARLADTKTGVTEEMQAWMFPGITKDMMNQFAKDMEFLLSDTSTDIGASISGQTRVTNPTGHLPVPVPKNYARLAATVPGIAMLHRIMLGKFYAMVVDGSMHPNYAHWLAGKLVGSPQDRAVARKVVRDRLEAAGLLGAMTGERLLHKSASVEIEEE